MKRRILLALLLGFALNAFSQSDSAAFVQLEIQRTIANIMTTPDWMKAIRKQAEQNGTAPAGTEEKNEV